MTEQKKFYNPYSFPVRVVNDRGEEQIFPPQDRGKVKENEQGEYEQSPLELFTYNAQKLGQQRHVEGFGSLDIAKLTKKELVELAWAVCLNTNFENVKKADAIKVIKEKAEGWKTFKPISTKKFPDKEEIGPWLQKVWVE